LITFAKPQDLPEGASPRTWDTDFEVGSVKSRPGLSSFFTYATTLQITSYVLVYGTATFGYIGTEPVTNEGFFLSGFTGNQSYLNGLEVFVETVSLGSFTAAVAHSDDGPIFGLSASAVSSTGIFSGPNVGSLFTGPSWGSPSNISSATAYASVVTGAIANAAGVPSSAANIGVGRLWVTPSNSFTTGAAFSTVALLASPNNSSDYLMVNFASLGVPIGANITGLVVTYKASYSGTGNASMTVDIQDGNFILGTPIVVPMSNATAPYSKGSSAYLWGTGFTSVQLNSGAFGVSLKAATSGAGTVSVNSVTLTVYYTASATSGSLLDQGFAFAVALTSGISGFGVSFKAFSSASTSVTLQLLQAGLPIGTPKTVALNTTATLYTLGGPEDPWGTLWSAGNVNSTLFGVQITASGTGTTSIGDLDVITYIITALENFNYVGSFEQNNSALTTFALDAAGDLWKEDVSNNPGVLSLALSGLLPNSFAKGATMNNQEFLMFSDLDSGTERPRLYTVDGNFYPVTQVGPGVAPKPQATTGSISGTLNLTTYSQAGSVGTFTFTAVAAAPTQDSLYVIAGTGTALDGQVVIVLAGSTVTTFTAAVKGTIPNGAIVGTATPQFFYVISSITQQPSDGSGNPYIHQAPQLGFLLGTGPGQGGTGTNVTVWYNIYGFPAWSALITAMANTQVATYIEITGAASVGGHNFNGIWQVTGTGQAHYPGTSNTGCYLTFTYTQSGSMGYTNAAGASIFLTAATMTLSTPVESLPAGTQFTITGATPSGWNNTWTISQALNGGQYDIDSTSYDVTTSLVTYQYHQAGNSAGPAVAGQLIRIQNSTNNAAFNGTFVINSTPTGSTFTVSLTPALPASVPQASDNQAVAVMFGTKFTFDPGETFLGTTTNVNYGAAANGQITIIGSNFTPIGAGTRQIACFFITASGNWTPASPPFTFTVPTDANLLNISGIPIGPPDTVGRGIMITEAGQNGVPGANFYVITVPVTLTVNGVTNTYTSTIINDNTSTTAAFSFTDAVLLNSQEVDIPGFNLFNLIEIGSCAWALEYSNRMFYGLQLNKVMNFNNLTFDGGYTVPNQPAGWGLRPTGQTLTPQVASEISLVNSPVTGSALYINNNTGSIQPQMGMMFQTAYQDPYNVAIISPNVSYSVRVAASCPSGIRLGNLVIDLTDISGGVYGTTYGSFTIPFSGMTTLVSVFSGVLLPKGIFTGVVDPTLNLRVWVQNMGIGADVLVDRIEVFPTIFPFLKTQVYGSYIGKPESVDASGDGGILDTSIQNPQAVMGAFVLRDSMYLLKTSSLYVTKDNPNSEPAGWSIDEVSNRAGACGINAFDTGEEWAIMGCRNGVFGFDGGKAELLNLEIMQIWNKINWDAGNSIVVRNDIENRRIYCAIPLPTGTSPAGVATGSTQWLPYASWNPAPTTPNVILMLNYQDIGSFQEMMADIGTHATMFGTLANPDMRRKWTIWQIPTPYMGTVLRGNLINNPIMICNGIASSKIYELDPNRHDDDGATIWSLYCTYGFVNAVKAATIPLFGMYAKRYTILQMTVEGAGAMPVRLLPNVLDPKYPYSVPTGIKLVSPANDDAFRPINVKGNRMFVEVSINAMGAWFQLHKLLLTGKADHWSSLNPTGGMNSGIQ
jgi:hypothetical protein